MILRDRRAEAVTLQLRRSRANTLAKSRPSRHLKRVNSSLAKNGMTNRVRNATIGRAKIGPTVITTATANAVGADAEDAEAVTADARASRARAKADARARAVKARVDAKVLTAAGIIIATAIHAEADAGVEATGRRHLRYPTF